MNASTALVIMVSSLALSSFAAPPSSQPARRDRAAWLRKARFGVMSHYLSDCIERNDPTAPPMTVERWNNFIDHFDVNALAKQLHEVGADYYLITIGQNSGYYLAPNATYDRIVGITPSHCSRRDLVSDLSAALAKYDIRLMVYLPSGAPDKDAIADKALQWENGAHRNAEFQKNWEAVIRDWSQRFGKKVSGWWFDGCYWPDAMYRSAEAPNFASFAAAARTGNPDAIVGFNPGVTPGDLHALTPAEDYTAGEASDPNAQSAHPDGHGLVEGATPHVLTYIGSDWARAPKRFTDEQLLAVVRRLKSMGIAVTLEVVIEASGKLPQTFVDQLKTMNHALPAN